MRYVNRLCDAPGCFSGIEIGPLCVYWAVPGYLFVRLRRYGWQYHEWRLLITKESRALFRNHLAPR